MVEVLTNDHPEWLNPKYINQRGRQSWNRHYFSAPTYSTVLKGYQLYALRTFGNTIVSKTHTKQVVKEECLNYGLAVSVRSFTTKHNSYPIEDTHWVVEVNQRLTQD